MPKHKVCAAANYEIFLLNQSYVYFIVENLTNRPYTNRNLFKNHPFI